MITFEEYFLRAIEDQDLLWLKNLRNDESTWSQLGHFVLLNERKQQKWFSNLQERSDVEYLVFGKGDENLGVVRLTEIDRMNRSVCVGGDILPQKRGQGHSKYMYRLIFRLCFDIWGMNRLWLLVLSTNSVAIHLYKKMGFIAEGVQRKAIYKNGGFIDYVIMSFLHEEYIKVK